MACSGQACLCFSMHVLSLGSQIQTNCEVSLFQHERKEHAMPDTCGVGCQNRIEMLSKLA